MVLDMGSDSCLLTRNPLIWGRGLSAMGNCCKGSGAWGHVWLGSQELEMRQMVVPTL